MTADKRLLLCILKFPFPKMFTASWVTYSGSAKVNRRRNLACYTTSGFNYIIHTFPS